MKSIYVAVLYVKEIPREYLRYTERITRFVLRRGKQALTPKAIMAVLQTLDVNASQLAALSWSKRQPNARSLDSSSAKNNRQENLMSRHRRARPRKIAVEECAKASKERRAS
jgi:hypothetical protein